MRLDAFSRAGGGLLRDVGQRVRRHRNLQFLGADLGSVDKSLFAHTAFFMRLDALGRAGGGLLRNVGQRVVAGADNGSVVGHINAVDRDLRVAGVLNLDVG